MQIVRNTNQGHSRIAIRLSGDFRYFGRPPSIPVVNILELQTERFEMELLNKAGKALILVLTVQLMGCSMMTSLLKLTQQKETLFAEAEKQREEFLIERTEESIKWLLSNLAKNGMSKGDIDRIIGEQGERVFDDTNILSGDGLYRADDLVYSWGPDKQGHSYMLVFRDNKLINFENFNPKNAIPSSVFQ